MKRIAQLSLRELAGKQSQQGHLPICQILHGLDCGVIRSWLLLKANLTLGHPEAFAENIRRPDRVGGLLCELSVAYLADRNRPVYDPIWPRQSAADRIR